MNIINKWFSRTLNRLVTVVLININISALFEKTKCSQLSHLPHSCLTSWAVFWGVLVGLFKVTTSSAISGILHWCCFSFNGKQQCNKCDIALGLLPQCNYHIWSTVGSFDTPTQYGINNHYCIDWLYTSLQQYWYCNYKL